ncbi:thioesterase family protein [Gordonia sp. ABSL1-1]|uniref:acyl-CoA thioesterase n=1 Tax=Gordonia sp. ABSL1-1 TaxID=3053923 RepID=UPI002573F70A|nr:thioesterase family protein [Gordonia sp. ABSL1-1]MDL9938537.1 thioesterase family protein [Gordonia sp. ABSL1-1]
MLIEDAGRATEDGYLVQVPVRWSDMDVFGHINHARMVTLLEEARIPWLFYDGRPTADMRHGCVVADLHVKYAAQLRHDEGPLQVAMFVSELRAVDFVVGYEVRPGKSASAGADAGSPAIGKPAVVASTRLVAFDVDKQALRRLTPDEKDYLKQFLRPDAGATGGRR